MGSTDLGTDHHGWIGDAGREIERAGQLVAGGDEHTRPRVLQDVTDFAPGQTGVDRCRDPPGFLRGEVGDLEQERILVREQDGHPLARHTPNSTRLRPTRRSPLPLGKSHRPATVDERRDAIRKSSATLRNSSGTSVIGRSPRVALLPLFGGAGVNSATPKSSYTPQLLALS